MRTHRPPHPRRRGDKSAGTGTPAWQAVGLPGSDGWLARMQRQGPDGRAAVMTQLQQGAGNRAMAQAVARTPSAGGLVAGIGSTLAEGAESLIDRAMSFTLEGTVGRNGKNQPQDVERVRARLKSLGFPATDDPATLEAAIERYQRDVVGLRKPDGRVDPAGRTLAALNQGQAAAPVGAPAVPGAAKPEAPAAVEAPGSSAAAPAPVAAKAVAPPPDIEALAARSPALKSALDGLRRVQGLAAAAQTSTQKIDDAEKRKKKTDPKGERTMGQEVGAERDRLVAEIKAVRKLIDDLKAGSGLTAAEVASVMAYLYRELARVAPYYYQIVNANILEKGGKAGGRTCNVTSLAMTLEALGKSSKDFKGPEAAMLPQIANVLPERVKTATDRVEGEEEMAALRLPDFLQLLVIAKFLTVDPALAGTDPAAFVKAVGKARNEAAGKITRSDLFPSFIGDFGVTVKNESPFGGMKVSGSDVSWTEAIDRVGLINRGSLPDARKKALETKRKAEGPKAELTKEETAAAEAGALHWFNTQRSGAVAGHEQRLAEVEAALKGATGKDKQALKKELAELKDQIAEGKRDKRLTGLGIHDAATDPKKLAKILPTETYKAVVSAALSKHLDAGHQVVGHMHNHFFRVEAVTADAVVIDDPGGWDRRSYPMPWEEALKKGSFSRFTVVTPT